MFSVARPHADVYLVVRIERILHSSGLDAYLKPDWRCSNKLEKVIGAACLKLAQYRMTFAWTARYAKI